jgi:flagellar FliL protein
MAKPAKPAAAKKEEAPVAVAAPKSKKKLIIIVVAAVVVIGAAAGWFLTREKPAHTETAKATAPKEPKFIPLETFTVNLQHEELDQYLQVNISLKVMEPELEDKIKAVLPEIRSKLNLLLSSKRPSELVTVAGKKKLAVDIATEANSVLGIHNTPEPVVVPAASGVAVAPAEGASAAVPAEPATPAEPVAESAEHSAAAEKKGVVDVLFTSFIIQ